MSETLPMDDATTSDEAVLGVECSLFGHRWVWRDGADSPATLRLGSAIAQICDVPEIVGRIMAMRGLRPDTAQAFVEPRLRNFLPDPSTLHGMDNAAARLALAVENGETVGVFGDYDVDGACSSALLTTWLRDLGCTVHTHIPDRIREGYGPNETALCGLAERGASLVTCLDCGTAAATILACLKDRADVIVIDHHKAELMLPDVLAVVNPNQPDCASGMGHLCAAALTFLTLVAATRALRQKGWFNERPEPDLMACLDLVALATICDVMPLRDLNRAFVHQGLRVMNKRARLGLRTLMEVASVGETPNAFTCGFALGPRINAGGRIAEAHLGLRLLTAQEDLEARQMAERLNDVNRKRQDVEADILDAAMEQARRQFDDGNPALLVSSRDWHPGVVGIVASRIKEEFNRPAFVASEDENGTLKGSGRSVPGLDVGSAVIAAKEHGLLIASGGHMAACGFTLTKDNLSAFHSFLNERLALAAERPRKPELPIDAVLPPSACTPELATALAILAPFGQHNEEPLLAIERVKVDRFFRIGANKRSIRLTLSGEGNRKIGAIMFNIKDDAILDVLEDLSRPTLHIAGWLRTDTWQGRETTTFFIRDLATL
ncbi:single-stranded-DNA-specific exonuclease RecJ [Acetobacter estunensis NRIC 0472]|uniref:Single-stranded-DNA-specific exonuclease RecJ n=1 Tax=Acetobacter estunensis TaxID=104097 RepID=A0A967EC53_9PROT|nr:single-stranded-DNA-specific exonuclease RecJ [Acetobacter estunensis]NHO52570.1 single-stranded-DNA-specific exonuclease RecJ [Acetobacter estunensis]GBQ22573.1 single-stranded-DNA-specific exonuclease RecJ [Acetobacter estunensis NRIC 0472]